MDPGTMQWLIFMIGVTLVLMTITICTTIYEVMSL